jgi:hypothetical protein
MKPTMRRHTGGGRHLKETSRAAGVLTLLLVFSAAVRLFAADVTVSSIVPAQLFPSGGQVACNPLGTACVWATSQYTSLNYSPSEIAGCLGGYTGGVFQCTGPVTCLTCNLDNTLFGYVQHSPSDVTKGQPFFEDTTGNYLFLWVSDNQGVSGCSTPQPMPGSGACGDTWYMSISTSPALSLSGAHNLTNIAGTGGTYVNGVLFARTGGNYIWLSYRFAPPDMVNASCALGAWGIRVWGPYTTTSGLSPGTELSSAASPFQPIGPCSYTEMSGFYDGTSKEFTFQGTPTGMSNYYWRNNIYGFNLHYTGSADLVVPWGTSSVLGLDAWNEHANTDASGSLIIWSSSVGATAVSYNGSHTHFGNCGAGCTGYLPLDKWAAPLPRWTDANGYPRLGQIGTAYQLTGLNALNSPDRAMTCALDGGCTATTAFSGGYADYTQPGVLTELIKDEASGNAALYSISLSTFTSRLLGSSKLSGGAVLK